MSRCKKVQSLLPGYWAQELTDKEKQFVESHLQTCETCRAVWEQEKEIVHRLKGMKREVNEAFLAETRQRLHRNLIQAAGKRRVSQKSLFLLGLRRPLVQMAVVVLIFLLGLWVGGRSHIFPLWSGRGPFGLKRQAPVPLLGAQIVTFNPQNGIMTVQLQRNRRVQLESRFTDPRVRQVLLGALGNASQDGQRLRALGIFLRTPPRNTRKKQVSWDVLQAVCQAARKDPNPGVRFKAIRVLSEFSADSLVKGTLLAILREDSVDAFRYEALSALVGEASRDVRPILQMLARKDSSRGMRARASHWLRRIDEKRPQAVLGGNQNRR